MRYTRPQHVGRSSFYSSWLQQQPADRQRELLAAERAYLGTVESPTGVRVAAAKDHLTALRGVAEVDPSTAT
jgi:hypothetical protein